jgi:3-oxosteroid 1-dehydrogenase
MTTGQVIVAGSGASGLVAALAAAAGGADVLVLERSEQLGGTTALGGGRVWVPANHCPENAGDSAEAARSYLGGLFPARYAHLTEAFVANAPAMARFVEERSPHRFAACPAYPDYHPERAGATAGGRCLDMELADLSAMAPQARQVRLPPGYLPIPRPNGRAGASRTGSTGSCCGSGRPPGCAPTASRWPPRSSTACSRRAAGSKPEHGSPR